MGSISFLALEAIGASIAISYGFTTAFWAILTSAVIIFLTAIPISYHAAKYNIDIDLITRSAGFGYVGSTITSLIYASFSFIFFALEAAILAQALELYFGLSLSWGYLLSALVIIPLTFYGITFINKLQLYTQPIWLILLFLPFVAVLMKEHQAMENFLNFSGSISGDAEFSIYYFGFALGISLSLIAQIGEQVDYLRFMPPLEKKNRVKWWFAVISAGPGWVLLGFLKQMGGIFLASIVLLSGLSLADAKTPIEMYHIAYTYVFDNPNTAILVATFFVILSQIKINITNAYAGSLAWSNFFSRVSHSHPGRVVWLVFNIAIALLLMEFGLFDALSKVLGLYSNVAIAWIGAITADLVINKPLGLSPKIIEFKRAYLYNINPVGVGSMGIASVVAILAFMGFFGSMMQSYSSLIALVLAFTLAPFIAWLTKGKYYIARENKLVLETKVSYICEMCATEYEKEDMVYCPLQSANICSLCCSLDSLCHDSCKNDTKSTLLEKSCKLVSALFFHVISPVSAKRILIFISLSSFILFLISISAWMIYDANVEYISKSFAHVLEDALTTLVLSVAILISVLVWWVLLLQENRKLAEQELEENNRILGESKAELEDQKELYSLVYESTESGVMLLDIEENKFIAMNEAVVKILQYNSKEELFNMSPSELSPEFQANGETSFEKSYEMNMLAVEQGSHNFEWINLTKTGEKVYVDVTLTPIILKEKQVLHVVSKNITQRVLHQEELLKKKDELDYQAHHDILTNLPNRLLFNESLKHAIDHAKRDEAKLAIFFIDLDKFKNINDSLGHQVGDKVLIEVAIRLQKSIREEDTLARIGGDEFTIFMQSLHKSEDASHLATKIINIFKEPMQIEGHELHVSTSIGISLFPDDAVEMHKLLMYADSAMYKAKESGRNSFEFYSSQMTEIAKERIAIESKLHRAIENEEFVVYYQPQIDASENKMIGMEALVRWQDPQEGLISPCRFIPIAEENGLIIPIDLWVMKTAMTQLVTWYKEGLNPGVLALNLSLKQLHQKDFIFRLKSLLEGTGCKPEWLELEVTESSIMLHPEESITLLQEISEMGIELAVDDFGTGYSSLSYLKCLPLDKLKIDKSFIDDLPDKEEDIGISKAIIALAKSLKLHVIAEGVETQEQLDFLLENGCKNIQGYLFSAPIDSTAMKEYLEDKIDILPDNAS